VNTTLDRVTAAAESHHESLRDGLVTRTELLITAVASRRSYDSARQELVEFLRDELLVHMQVEADLLYSAGERGQSALLVAAMLDEQRMMATLVRQIDEATDPLDVVIAAGALVVLFDVCADQENRYLLPALAAAGVDLPVLLQEAPEVVGAVATGQC
jgi:iron-sulfur cluster repair protein YtfE (RIC family)